MPNARSATTDASYRTARLKAIASRSGPAPPINSESWLLTKQQGCCTPVDFCAAYNCAPATFNTLENDVIDNYLTYNVTELDISQNVTFTIAAVTSNCDKPGCANYLSIVVGGQNVDSITEDGITFAIIRGYTCTTPLLFTTTTTTPFTVTFDNLQIASGDCGSGDSDNSPLEVNIRLIYDPPT